jgi:hypothetical protein
MCTDVDIFGGRIHELYSDVYGSCTSCEESILEGKNGGSSECMDAL